MKEHLSCKNGHEDGWIIDENIVIDIGNVYGTTEEVECKCNHYGCQERKKLSLDVVNVEEIK